MAAFLYYVWFAAANCFLTFGIYTIMLPDF